MITAKGLSLKLVSCKQGIKSYIITVSAPGVNGKKDKIKTVAAGKKVIFKNKAINKNWITKRKSWAAIEIAIMPVFARNSDPLRYSCPFKFKKNKYVPGYECIHLDVYITKK